MRLLWVANRDGRRPPTTHTSGMSDTVNTVAELMYRDAANYKTYDRVVFAGAPSPELLTRATAQLGGPGSNAIICAQLDLEDVDFDGTYEDDSPWVEVTFRATPLEPDDERTFAEFVAALEAVEWDPAVHDPVLTLVDGRDDVLVLDEPTVASATDVLDLLADDALVRNMTGSEAAAVAGFFRPIVGDEKADAFLAAHAEADAALQAAEQ
jgi:hypothetical protein